MASNKLDLKMNLIVDFGNSDIKLISLESIAAKKTVTTAKEGGLDAPTTTTPKGRVKKSVADLVPTKMYIPSAYAPVFETDNIDSKYYTDGNSIICDITMSEEVTQEGSKKPTVVEITKKISHGLIAETEFLSKVIRPSGVTKQKAGQLTTKYALAVSIIKALRAYLGFEDVYMNTETINVTLSVVGLLPPDEYYNNLTKHPHLVEELNKITTIVDYVGKTDTVNINIKNLTVNVASEALSTYAGLVYNSKGEIKPENEKYAQGYVLVIDIGEGTSDVIIVKDAQPIYTFRDTFPIGGRLVESSFSKAIKGRSNGFIPTPERTRSAIETGSLQRGAEFIPVTDELLQAKQEFTMALYTHIDSYFARINLDLANLTGIVFGGGGSLPSKETDSMELTTPSIQTLLLDLIKEMTGSKLDAITADDPRFANVNGAYLSAIALQLLI